MHFGGVLRPPPPPRRGFCASDISELTCPIILLFDSKWFRKFVIFWLSTFQRVSRCSWARRLEIPKNKWATSSRWLGFLGSFRRRMRELGTPLPEADLGQKISQRPLVRSFCFFLKVVLRIEPDPPVNFFWGSRCYWVQEKSIFEKQMQILAMRGFDAGGML